MEKKMPKLRFPEFEGEWEVKTLGEIADKRIIKNKDGIIKNVLTNSAVYGIVSQRDFFDKDIANPDNLSGYYVVEKNDFVYNPRISVSAPVGPISMSHKEIGIMSPLYSVFRFNKGNLDFIECFFNTTKWHLHMEDIANYGARADRMSFSVGDFYKMPIPFPSLPEQTKIANFLSAVDDKITQLKKKKELLEQYKKGVMQQIFSNPSVETHGHASVRFKDEHGEDFPDWEEKKLGECLKYEQPTNYLVSSSEYDDKNNIPVVTAGKTFILGYTNETFGVYEANLPVIIFDDFTTASQFVTFPFKAKSSAMKILTANVGFNIRFMYEALQTIKYEIGGHGRHWISIFAEMSILTPSLPEQTKIANFLSAIDDKINHCGKQIEKMEAWKKGLLQGMFV